MWIRTECGKIIDLSDIYGYVRDGYYFNDDLYESYKIKKNGDNLIDVLEIGDIVLTGTEEKILVGTLKTEKRIVIDDTYFYEPFKTINSNYIKVITHEQYMPLAQEVKC